MATPDRPDAAVVAGGLDVASPVFVIGAPRSGTTWLQRLLASHPQVVSSQETNLFDKYIAPLDEMFTRQIRQLRHLPRMKGLPAVLSRGTFEELLGGLVIGTYAELGKLKPAATVVVDKNPPHTLFVPLIRRLLPQARFLHIVRDGRDVAASLVAAHAGWGRYWAPARVAEAAHIWQRYVLAAGFAKNGDGSFMEVRYEQLRSDGPATLCRAFAFAGVGVDTAQAEEILAGQASYPGNGVGDSLVWGGEVPQGQAPAEPVGFRGTGRSGSWRDWSSVDRAGFDQIAGELLVQLGYTDDHSWADGPGWARYAHQVQDAGYRIRRQLLANTRRAIRPTP